MKILLGATLLAVALAVLVEPRRRRRLRIADTWAAETDRL